MMGRRFAWLSIMVAAVGVAALGTAVGATIAQTPSISGNFWVAVGIVATAAIAIVMLILGALRLERRDAFLGRRHHDGWFGVFPHDGDGHGGNGNGGS